MPACSGCRRRRRGSRSTRPCRSRRRAARRHASPRRQVALGEQDGGDALALVADHGTAVEHQLDRLRRARARARVRDAASTAPRRARRSCRRARRRRRSATRARRRGRCAGARRAPRRRLHAGPSTARSMFVTRIPKSIGPRCPHCPRQSCPAGSRTTGSIAAPWAGIGIVMCCAGRCSGSYQGSLYHGAIGSKKSTDSNRSCGEPEPLVERARPRHVGDAEGDVVHALRPSGPGQRAPEAGPLDHLELRPPGVGDVRDVEVDVVRHHRGADRRHQLLAAGGDEARVHLGDAADVEADLAHAHLAPGLALRARAAARRRRAPARA